MVPPGVVGTVITFFDENPKRRPAIMATVDLSKQTLEATIEENDIVLIDF